MSAYLTIESPTDGQYKEKGSKFFAHAYPLKRKEDIPDFLKELRGTYHDARHHCYAWVFGLDDQEKRANDDGEPSHSAGDPIMGQIHAFNLTNVLVVVVRYFGGTKLGVGGLINAYKTAAQQALEKATVKELFEMSELSLKFGYDQLSSVERLIGDFELEVVRDYGETCQVNGHIKKQDIDRFLELTKDFYQIQITITQ